MHPVTTNTTKENHEFIFIFKKVNLYGKGKPPCKANMVLLLEMYGKFDLKFIGHCNTAPPQTMETVI